MKNNTIIYLLGFIFLCIACSEIDDLPTEEDQENESTNTDTISCQDLDTLWVEIISLVESVNCHNPDNWSVTPYGAKACGGPSGFIAFSNTIDTTYFLELVEQHRIAQNDCNVKNGAISDCSVELPPDRIICQNDKPELIYD